jgi:type IV pilus assembly protein PilW
MEWFWLGMKKMKYYKIQNGFTLIEIMVAIAISSIVITSMYEIFYSQQRSYINQDQVAEMQQNLRAGLYLTTKDIRSAGFDPTRSGRFGFVVDFAAPDNIFDPDINYAVDKNVIAFTVDDSADGFIQSNDAELIAYRLNDNNLERYIFNIDNKGWQIVANNIDALDFVYLDQNGAVTNNPANFRAVEISLLVKTGKKDKYFTNTQTYQNKQGQNICPSCSNDNYRRRLLSTTVHVRNT